MKLPNFILFAIIFGCTPTTSNTENYNETISGHWNMHQVYQKGNDVTPEHNPEMERYIIFREDGTFESGGSPYGKNTGAYEVDQQQKILFIDSDAGEDDDSRWKVENAGDTLKWEGIGSDFAESFRLVHVRKK